MTQGTVGITVYGPPVPSTFGPSPGPAWQVNPQGLVTAGPNGLTTLHGMGVAKGPSGLPMGIPFGCESDGPREILASEMDHNLVTAYTEFLMFMGALNNTLEFNDGTYNYLGVDTSYPLGSGFFVSPTAAAEPSGLASYITPTSGTAIFMSDSSGYR